MVVAEETTRRSGVDLARVDPNKLGMGLFLAGEVFFFGSFILTYAYYRTLWATYGGPTGAVLNIPLTGLFTVLLLSSSVTIWLAERSLRAGSQTGLRLWLALTVVLGAGFLLGQAYEWNHFFADGITIRSGLFGTTFFALTGFHGFHVLMGLVALTILLVAALAGWLKGPHSSGLATVSLYWHFVDVVWIVVFSVVYLWELVA